MKEIDHHASLDEYIRLARIIEIIGPPDSGKTTSLYTSPVPVKGIVCPGEGGSSSIPLTTREGHSIQLKRFEEIEWDNPKEPWREYAKAFDLALVGILSGKTYGPMDDAMFVLDGAHKLYDLDLAAASDGGSVVGRAEIQHYGEAHKHYVERIRRINSSRQAKFTVYTIWDAIEVVNQTMDTSPQNTKNVAKAEKGHYVELPKGIQRRVPGMFSLNLFAQVVGPARNPASYKWATMPVGDNKVGGVKLPIQIVQQLKLPPTVPQDFKALDEMIVGELTRIWNNLNKKEVVA